MPQKYFGMLSTPIPDSLQYEAEDGIGNALRNRNPATDLKMFDEELSVAGEEYVRNAGFWGAGFDFSGLSIWNSLNPSSLGQATGGTAISPLHLVIADHYPMAVGTFVKFLGADNVLVEREVIASTRVGTTDFRILTLGEELPESVAIYRAFPDLMTFAAPLTVYPLKGLMTDQSNQARPIIVTHRVADPLLFQLCGYSLDSDYSSWTGFPGGGDSGHPAFVVVDGELILVSTHTTVSYGFALCKYAADVNAVISPYTIGVIDLTEYDT